MQQGRLFGEYDNENAPSVAIINKIMARQVWPGEDPLGKRLRTDRSGWITIVGVVQDLPGAESVPEVYLSYSQVPASRSWFVLARASADPASVAPRLSEALRSVNQGLVHELGILEEILAASKSR